MPKLKQITPQHLRAMIQPESVNVEERSIEVVFATGTPVRRYSWEDGYVEEVLSFDDGHVRWDRINSGAPVLDNHRASGSVAESQIGVVERAWKDTEGKGRAKIRFAKDGNADIVFQRVQDGIVRNISVGYNVYTYQKTERQGSTPEYRAIDWEPYEISMVTVPADFNAGVRSENTQTNDVIITSLKQSDTAMKREQVIALLQKRGIQFEEKATDEQLVQLLERALETPPAPPAPAATEGDDAKVRAAAEAERKRAAEIIKAVRAAKLGDEFAEGLIERGVTLDAARAAIIDEFAKQDPNAGTRSHQTVHVGAEDVEKRRAAMTDALLLRAGVAIEKPAAGANDFRGMSLLRMAEEHLVANGVKTRGMSARELAETALNLRTYHSTSDFPIILGNTINRSLRAAYELAPRTFMPFCRRTTARDFKQMTKAQISGLTKSFDKINEGGEYKYGSLTEAAEAYKVEKYGQIVAVTWETLINDDLDAFSRIPQAIANKAAQKQSDIVWGIITSNPNMADNEALFSVAHGNLAASATAIVEAGLSAARKAMRNQKSLEGDFINVTPSFLMCGPDKETEAQKLLQATIVATKTADTNVFQNYAQLIVEPRLTGNQWYLAASPNMVDTIEYAFLEGEGELFTEQRTGFEVDGLEIKARMVFGAKAIDWRGLYKNAGA